MCTERMFIFIERNLYEDYLNDTLSVLNNHEEHCIFENEKRQSTSGGLFAKTKKE